MVTCANLRRWTACLPRYDLRSIIGLPMTCRTVFDLRFSLPPSVELVEASFAHASFDRPLVVRRGKGTFDGKVGSFQWTSAVRALSELALRSFLWGHAGTGTQPLLSGERGSLASSLDLALTKEPNWLAEMFGVDSLGTLLAKRVFLRSNSNLKRPGPVEVRLNDAFLDPRLIVVRALDGRELSLLEVEELIQRIAASAVRSETEAQGPEHAKRPIVDLRAIYAYAAAAPFVGREEELAQLRAAAENSERRPIAVLGPPGIGKSHLVIRALENSEEPSGSGRYLVPVSCEGLKTSQDIEQRIALQLGHTRRVSVATLARALQDSSAILFLDDAEYPLRADEQAFVQVLQTFSQIPDVQLVAVFRGNEYPQHALRWSTPIVLRPLPAESTEALLCQLLTHTPEADVLRELVETTAGVPIAIQSLSKRARGYADLRDLLQEYRQESLSALEEGAGLEGLSRSAIRSFELALSDPLINEEARVLLRVIAQYPSGVTRARLDSAFPKAARPVCISLVRAGLLSNAESSGRLHCLPPIRRFVEAKLALPRSHLDVFHRAIFEFTTQNAPHVGYQEDGMRCGQLILSELGEIVASIDDALNQPHPRDAIDASIGLANFVDFTGFGDTKLLLRAALVAEENQMPDRAAELYERIGDIAFVRSDMTEARDYFQKALTYFSARPNKTRHAKCAKRLADIAVERGDSRMAVILYAEAEALYGQANDEVGTARCFRGRAVLALREGKLKKAAALCREALTRFRRNGDRLGQANGEKTAGLVALLSGQAGAAKLKLKAAFEQFELLGDTLGVAETSRYLGALAATEGQLLEAEQLVLKAHAHFEALSRAFEMHEAQLALLALRNRKQNHGDRGTMSAELEAYYKTNGDIAAQGCKLLFDLTRLAGPTEDEVLEQVEDLWRRHRRCDLLIALTGFRAGAPS